MGFQLEENQVEFSQLEAIYILDFGAETHKHICTHANLRDRQVIQSCEFFDQITTQHTHIHTITSTLKARQEIYNLESFNQITTTHMRTYTHPYRQTT